MEREKLDQVPGETLGNENPVSHPPEGSGLVGVPVWTAPLPGAFHRNRIRRLRGMLGTEEGTMHEVDQVNDAWIAAERSKAKGLPIQTEAPRTSLYTALENVYRSAFGQAAFGKGKERHAGEGERFEDQFICQGQRDFGLGGGVFQAVKKCKEALGMVERGELDRARFELLGAMNYLAATVIVVEEKGRVGNASRG